MNPSEAVAGVLGGAPVVQNAYVVNDIRAGCRRWHALTGHGPFVGSRRFILPMIHRGRPISVELAGAFVQAGAIVVELLQQLDEGPSPFRDMFPPGREGLHHTAVFTDDFNAVMDRARAAGIETAAEMAYAPGCRIAYLDTTNALGHMVEVYTDHPAVRDLYDAARDAAGGWDGTDLIRLR